MSTQHADSPQNLDSLSFEERLQLGANNAVHCMGITADDHVFILTDYARVDIARRVVDAILARHARVTLRYLENYGTRPLTVFTDELRQELIQSKATVSYYIATALPGEIAFRIPLLPFLTHELKLRHGHMIGIDEQLMTEGMCADYNEVYTITNKIYEIARHAKTIHVTSEKGSDVTATFNPDWKWVPCNGRYDQAGKWGNLPEGETFTTPATLNGTLVCDVLGDHFAHKYGVLKTPVILKVKDSYITEVSSDDEAIATDLRDYLFSVPNGNRAGEFAIGTLTSLKHLTGNLLQDEKMPGLHVAFGDPYPNETGANWTATIHVDVIPTKCTIEIDGREIMKDGVFTV